MTDPRDIERFVRQSAEKQKSLDEKRENSDRNRSIHRAVDEKKSHQSDIEKKLKRGQKDYLNVVLSTLLLPLFILFCFSIYRLVQSARGADEKPWKVPVVKSEDFAKAQIFVKTLVSKVCGGKDINDSISNDTPAPWKSLSREILLDLGRGNYEISDVFQDEMKKGEKALLTVSCKSKELNTKVYLVLSDGELSLLKVDKLAKLDNQGK